MRRSALFTACCLAGLACGLASCGSTRPGHLAGPRPGPPVAVGINTDITWGIRASDVKREVSLIREAGVGWIRASVDLSGAEPSRGGQLNLGYLRQIDTAVRMARAAGLNVLLEFDRAPYWASADPHKYWDSSGPHWNHYWTYADSAAYARITADMVKRYKRLGVHAYELWSEPNYATFWPSGVSAQAYTKLLAAAYPAVKKADPEAVVLLGGLSDVRVYGYLQALYRAGAARFYDVANFHIYPGGDPENCALGGDGRPSTASFCALDALRKEMLSNGDLKPAWVTEIGWSTCSRSPCVSPAVQASYLAKSYRLLSDRNYFWVKAQFVYMMRDLTEPRSEVAWGASLGVLTRNLAPKPAFTALKQAASDATATTSASASRTGHAR